MGLSLEEWGAYVAKHGLKFKFEGLSGGWNSRDFFDSVGEAATMDEQFMDRYVENEVESQTKELISEIAQALAKEPPYLTDEIDEYVDWLREDMGEIDDEEDEEFKSNLDILKEHHDEWKCREYFGERWTYDDSQWAWECLKEKHNEEWLLKEHPPIEVLSHAYDMGIPLEDVVFICPSCGGEPQFLADYSDLSIDPGYFYCGSCGASTQIGADWNWVIRMELRRHIALFHGSDYVEPEAERYLVKNLGWGGSEEDASPDALRELFTGFAADFYAGDIDRKDYFDSLDYNQISDTLTTAHDFHNSLYTFFESMDTTLYPFDAKKRREFVNEAMQKYGSFFERPAYWIDQIESCQLTK
jgi:ribosomal protein S27AE